VGKLLRYLDGLV
jgi:hypothetical protein